jgi:hypothetical protein
VTQYLDELDCIALAHCRLSALGAFGAHEPSPFALQVHHGTHSSRLLWFASWPELAVGASVVRRFGFAAVRMMGLPQKGD